MENGSGCEERDLRLMRLALAEGEIALQKQEIPVGCVFIGPGDVVVARGSNRTNELRNGTSHAEMNAINQAAESGLGADSFLNCELFVTCEPCIMCAAAISRLGIKRVVFGCSNDRFGGNGSILDVHEDGASLDGYHSYEAVSGVLSDEAIEMFQRFYVTENKRAPIGKRKRKNVGSEGTAKKA
jgi:tRNA-specific adenosine deaminase 2